MAMKCYVFAIAIDPEGAVQQEEENIVAEDLPEALHRLAEKIRRGGSLLDTSNTELLTICATSEGLSTELERKTRQMLQ
jgi:hypothetical protein